MNLLNYSEIINDKKEEIIFALKEKFVCKNQFMGLIWNSFICHPKCVPSGYLKKIGETILHEVYFYIEREDKLYLTYFTDIVNYVEKLEYWDEIDAYIFDKSMQWIIAITHEDNQLLCIGI